MTEACLLRRHRAYFSSWAQAFGEHDLLRDSRLELRWLLGEGQVGLVLAPSIRNRLRGGDDHSLGGLFADEPGPPAAQVLKRRPPRRSASSVAIARPVANQALAAVIDVGGETLRLGRLTLRQCPHAVMDALRRLLGPERELHLFESYHLMYPTGTRILTLSLRAPLGLVYRELTPALIRAAPMATPVLPRLREAACA
jgi:hypothetical protein